MNHKIKIDPYGFREYDARWLYEKDISREGITNLGSCIIPILYSSAANEPGYTAESAIAVVSTISFTGFFIGPPIIGFISEQHGLSLALVLVVGLSIMISAIGAMIQFK